MYEIRTPIWGGGHDDSILLRIFAAKLWKWACPIPRFNRTRPNFRFGCAAPELDGKLLEHGLQNLTRSADLHFFFPAFLNLTFTNRSIDKPAQFSGLKFPGRAFFLLLGGTFFDLPARLSVFTVFRQSGYQKKHLSLYVGRHFTPPLLVAVDCL